MQAGDYDALILKNEVIPLSDGCKTAADIYLPRDGGRLLTNSSPVILERTPYDKNNPELAETALFFARHGYGVVLQDVRGRFGSEGSWYKATGEGQDGYDTVEWISRQPWCDGKVNTMGLSYSTCTQASMASLAPPNLGAQFLSQGIGSYYRAAARRGGALELRQVVYLMRQAGSSPQARAEPTIRRALEQIDTRGWLLNYPVRRGASPLKFVPSYEQYLLDLQSHGEFDEWWKTPGHSPILYTDSYPDVPLFYLGSWFDHHVLMQTKMYNRLVDRKKQPLRLMIGPWLHGVVALGMTGIGKVEFGPEAEFNYDEFRLRWYDAVGVGHVGRAPDHSRSRLFGTEIGARSRDS